MKTNPDLLMDIIMTEAIELRTPHPSQCICTSCQGEKWRFAERVTKKVLQDFQRKKTKDTK